MPRPKSFRKSKKSVRKSKKSLRRHDNPEYPPEGFLRETIAYKHLRGFHSDSILQCYATLKIQEPSKRLTTISSEVRVIIEELPSPTYAVLLEYLPDAQILSPENITEEISNQLCETLSVFHKIGISHGDPYPRNILVSYGRVVWIDFDCSRMGRAAEFLEREADDFKEGICNNLVYIKIYTPYPSVARLTCYSWSARRTGIFLPGSTLAGDVCQVVKTMALSIVKTLCRRNEGMEDVCFTEVYKK